MSDANPQPAAAPAPGPVPRRRRWLKRLVLALVLLVVVVAGAPYIAARAPFRNWLLGAALGKLNVTARATGATFGWFDPVSINDLEILDRDGKTLVTVSSVAGDVPLWRMLYDRTQLGVFRIEQPRIEITLREGGSNLRDVVEKIKQEAAEREKRHARPPLADADLGIDLIDGTVIVRREGSDRSWDAQHLQFSARVAPAAEGPGRELVVAPGRLLDHVAITPEVCDDLLKFVAPSLAKVGHAGGAFSLELDNCRVPLENPKNSVVSGRFTMHDLTAGPGPLIESLATTFGISDKNQLAHEDVIHFQVKDGLVYHEGFALTVGPMGVATQGTVTLADQTLDIKLSLRMPEFQNKTAPFRGALTGETLKLPIRGTLAHPQIDPRGLRDSGLQVLSGVLEAFTHGKRLTPEAIQHALREGKLLDTPEATPTEPGATPQPDAAAQSAAPTGPAFPFLESILQERARLREQRQAEAAASAAQTPPGSPQAVTPPTAPVPPGERPLLRRARRLFDGLQTPPPAPSPPPAASGPRSF